MMRARTRISLLLPLAVLAAGCGRPEAFTGPEPAAFPGAPIVLISIDTLRSDRLPAYGYTGVATPAIDRLARDGVVFERAYSQYPITLPSHATLFTGELPTEHGVRDNIGYRLDTEGRQLLAPLLKSRGYRTGGAVSVFLLRRDTGLGEGFDFYEDSIDLGSGTSLGESQRPGGETLRHAREWLDTVAGEPFFLFLHLYEPHTPWEPPEPFLSRYPDRYDGEVAAADALVGELLADLDRLGLYDEAIVLLLSDHGEGLGDHGEPEHGILLYREAIQVPMILKLPRSSRAGARVTVAAQLADVYPTLARLAGEAVAGVTLLDLAAEASPQRAIYAETYYPRLHLGWSDLASLIEGDLHYIDGPAPELYDLAVDPAERYNLVATRESEAAEMGQRLAALRRDLAAPGAVDAETARRLEALGYLSTPVAAADGPLPDPKSRLSVLGDLMAVSRAQAEGRHEEAVETLARVLEENPGMADAWETLAQSLQQLGRWDEAIAAYGKALDLSQGTDHVALGAARLYLTMGRFDEARAHADLAVATNPAVAHRVLARVALAAGELDEAEQQADAALAARPNAAGPLVTLAQVAVEKGEVERARQLIEQAEEVQGRRHGDQAIPGLHLTRGDVLARLGQEAEAEAAFREEIERYPAEPRAYARLAVLLVLESRPEEAVAVLRRLVEDNETPPAYAAAVETFRVLGDPQTAASLLGHALGKFPDSPQLRRLAGLG